MSRRALATTTLVATLTLAPLAWAQPPAKGWKSSLTDPTTATSATVKITKSSSAQVKVASGNVTFILKLNGVVDKISELPVTTTLNTVEFVFLVNGGTHTKGFTFGLTAGKTDNSLTKFSVSLSDAGTWGSVLSPGEPIELRQVRVIEFSTGDIFGVDGFTTK